jgi:hypothetical protein
MKIKADCERRHLRGCRGCVALATCAASARRVKLYVAPYQGRGAYIEEITEPRRA